MINYNFNIKDQILYLQYTGEINEKNIVDLYDKLLNDNTLPNDLLIFQDENQASHPWFRGLPHGNLGGLFHTPQAPNLFDLNLSWRGMLALKTCVFQQKLKMLLHGY